jgi:hypothetical protein
LLTVVLGVAVLGIAVLAAAVLTGNTILAIVVIAIAAVGLILLARDWVTERRRAKESAANRGAEVGYDEPDHAAGTSLDADEFEPDVPYENSPETGPPSQPAGKNDD